MKMSSLLGTVISLVMVCMLTGAGSCRMELGVDQLGAFPSPLSVAWKRAGAVTGWMNQDQDGRLEFRQGSGEGKQGGLPAFQFPQWEAGKVKTLPAPSKPFALDLHSSGV